MTTSNLYGFVVAGGSVLALTLLGCTAEPATGEDVSGAQSSALVARKTLSKKLAPRRPASKHRLIAKFADHLRMRATATGAARSMALGSAATLAATDSNVPALAQLSLTFGMRYTQLIQLPPDRLASLETRAALATGEVPADLAGILVVDVPEARMQAAADALHASPLTEFVYFQELAPPPPQVCADLSPVTPSYAAFQSYRGPNPGLNIDAARALGPTRGAGVRIADCEYGFTVDHEDLCGVISEPGQTPAPFVAEKGYDEHGTAVLGQLVSRENGYGCTGLVPDAEAYFFPEWTVEEGPRRTTAIANAIATMDAGDVVLLEMQTEGPTRGYGPAELDPAVWTVTKTGTDAGVIVVAAAGNGFQDLDDPMYAEYMSRGDSGAIIVGAGTATTSHDQIWFSTYGSRVNVQAWGEFVFTTGYGSFAEHGGDKRQRYTDSFGGTSSASPLVAAAVVAIQDFAESWMERRLTPGEMRSLLIETGVPQGAGGHIGPLPDVAAAINAIKGEQELPRCGDSTCDASEACDTCPGDCGPCPTTCVPKGCETAGPVGVPYLRDGAMDTCVFFNGPTSHVSSWNMARVELNGLDVTNLWVSSSLYPATCNGGYYLRSIASLGWSHVEAR